MRTVIGLGTGRCGTTSLTRLLMAQRGARVMHERAMLPWVPDRRMLAAALADLLRGPAELSGDVSPLWLPYVEAVLETLPAARFICVVRDREATVRSFLSHAILSNGRMATAEVRALRLPVFAARSLEQAVGMWWDAYRAEATRLAALLPARFRMWDVEALNDPAGIGEILSFIGIPEADRVDSAPRDPRCTLCPVSSALIRHFQQHLREVTAPVKTERSISDKPFEGAIQVTLDSDTKGVAG
jgi:hypothetical protein